MRKNRQRKKNIHMKIDKENRDMAEKDPQILQKKSLCSQWSDKEDYSHE